MHDREGRHRPPLPDSALPLTDWRVDEDDRRLTVAGGGGPAENLRRALAAMGGIEAFVKRGEKVAIKPNCAWDRRPQQAANTDPRSSPSWCGCASRPAPPRSSSSTTPATTRAGHSIAPASPRRSTRPGLVRHQNNVSTEVRNLGGSILGSWEVLRPIVEADRVINVPIVKHHS